MVDSTSIMAPVRFRLRRRWQLWVGPALIAVFWPLNWFLPGIRTSYLFFPLWLGYILTVDGWVSLRTGSSLLERSREEFVRLFFVSAPAWWLFELINWRTQNWEYLGGQHFTDFEYFILASISFSTVMPAVFETAELLMSFSWVDRFRRRTGWRADGRTRAGLFAGGWAMFALVMVWPTYFYPLVWGSLVLILEPLNSKLGRPSQLGFLAHGDGRPTICLALGALVCGLFWELWNYYSYPKWIYHTPGAEFWRIFEMPLLGYLGYLPFAWELFALKNFVWPSETIFSSISSTKTSHNNNA